MDLLTPAYRGAAAAAQRLPRGVVDRIAATAAVGLASLRSGDRRAMVERHQRRITPGLRGAALQKRVRDVYGSYAHYYAESFRLPTMTPAELDAGLTHEGFEHIDKARAGGHGALLAMPHLGSWEWAAYWLTRVKEIPVTAVVERIEPPALFDWFVGYRRAIGMEIVPLGPHAARDVVSAVRRLHVIPLLSDRDIGGGGVEVTFFGEKTRLPAGPAVIAMRTGAPVLPTAVYDQGPGHHGVIRPPLDVARTGSFRSDVARVTQALADELEMLIRRAPEQWHLLQPNWPSDRSAAPVRL